MITPASNQPGHRPLRDEVRWEKMFRDELDQAFEACPLLYLPYGICEPHGPGNALGMDALKAHGLACAAARAHGGIVAPPWFWHIAAIGGDAVWCHEAIGQVERSWFTPLPPWLFLKNLCYHIRTAEHYRFHAAILLTGHSGPFHADTQRMLVLLQPHVSTRLFVWATEDIPYEGFGKDNRRGGHAGKEETSLMWALDPNCVDVSRLPAQKAGPDFAMDITTPESSRRIGEKILAESVEWLGQKGREMLAEYDQLPAETRQHCFITFEQVEQFWEKEIRPIIHDFIGMQDLWEGQRPIPSDSVWYPNWHVPDRS